MSLNRYRFAKGIFPKRATDYVLTKIAPTLTIDVREYEAPDTDRLKPFYAEVRKLTRGLTQVQVDSIEAILERTEDLPLQQTAYILATAWHEARFVPQREWGRGLGRPYHKKGKYGQRQYGRGLVQLTWDFNYEWADRAIGLGGALLDDFDLALEPEIAADILVKGMLEGAFARDRKGLGYYHLENGKFDYVNARRTVNLMDKAHQIAGYAEHFERALRAKEAA